MEIPVVLSDTNKYDGQATDFPGSGAVVQAAGRGGRCGKGIASRPDTNLGPPTEPNIPSCTAVNGHNGFVRMLLERNNLNPSLAD